VVILVLGRGPRAERVATRRQLDALLQARVTFVATIAWANIARELREIALSRREAKHRTQFREGRIVPVNCEWGAPMSR